MSFHLSQLYRDSLGLLTDLYELTMAYGYWRIGIAERPAVFHVNFRRCPFHGEYAIACGLAYAIDWMSTWSFTESDRAYLATLTGNDGRALFEPAFLDYLADLQFACDVDALPEGTAVFAQEPLARIRGPLLQAQLLETTLLNILNFQTLIATKAARVCEEAAGQSVIEFGLRRAQGIDGGIAASRAAFVGGCEATSNVLAGKLFGIPVRGTHAHSWVMAFDSELEAFRRYAEALPNNCVLLVDTYDSLRGVANAVRVGRELRSAGHELIGIRLDSGDLTVLSQEARRLLDEGGFPQAVIVASNDLDEHLVRDLNQQGARIDVWGIGTRLATAFEQPALGGVYKLAAIQDESTGGWLPKIKLSEQAAKVSNPGILQVRRFSHAGQFVMDVLYDESLPGPAGGQVSARPLTGLPFVDSHGSAGVTAVDWTWQDMLVPVFRAGRQVYEAEPVTVARERALQQRCRIPAAIKRLKNPSPYMVGLEKSLRERKMELIARHRAGSRE